ALKFLGFSLEEIQRCLLTGPRHLPAVLAQQKAMLREKRAQLDTIVAAIERAQSLLQDRQCTWDSIIRRIQVMQVEKKRAWVDTSFAPEQRQKMEGLSQASYSEAGRQKLAARSPQWTEEDQKRVEAQWGWVNAEVKRLLAAGADPAGPEAQNWAKV